MNVDYLVCTHKRFNCGGSHANKGLSVLGDIRGEGSTPYEGSKWYLYECQTLSLGCESIHS